jgi:hypothetical protein
MKRQEQLTQFALRIGSHSDSDRDRRRDLQNASSFGFSATPPQTVRRFCDDDSNYHRSLPGIRRFTAGSEADLHTPD